MKVGDVVKLKEDWQIKGIYYGLGVVISIVDTLKRASPHTK